MSLESCLPEDCKGCLPAPLLHARFPAACAVLAGDVPKLLFTLEAMDQPDPFAHGVGVPTSVRDAIWLLCVSLGVWDAVP